MSAYVHSIPILMLRDDLGYLFYLTRYSEIAKDLFSLSLSLSLWACVNVFVEYVDVFDLYSRVQDFKGSTWEFPFHSRVKNHAVLLC